MRRGSVASAAIALVLAVSGCGSDDGAGDRPQQLSATEHNDADVGFATDLIQHHAQALSMADLTRERSLDRDVQRVVDDIRAVQAVEIETMSDWLLEWGEEIPATMRDHSHVGHDGGSMSDAMEGLETDLPGMLSAEDIAALESASDADFQDMWLAMMIDHHEGAIEIAEEEQTDGRHQAAVDLAAEVVETQAAQVEAMKAAG